MGTVKISSGKNVWLLSETFKTHVLKQANFWHCDTVFDKNEFSLKCFKILRRSLNKKFQKKVRSEVTHFYKKMKCLQIRIIFEFKHWMRIKITPVISILNFMSFWPSWNCDSRILRSRIFKTLERLKIHLQDWDPGHVSSL